MRYRWKKRSLLLPTTFYVVRTLVPEAADATWEGGHFD